MFAARSLVVVSCSLVASPAWSQSIPIRQLDSTGAFTSDQAARVRHGVAAGFGVVNGKSNGALWDAAGSHALPPLQGNGSASAADFDDLGDVVGTSVKSFSFFTHATLWQGGAAIDLNSLVVGGAPLFLATATAVDAHGRIAGAGAASPIATPDAGFLYDGGIVTDLGTLVPGAHGMSPVRMNDRLQIVGTADAGGGVTHATLWDNGTLTDLHDPAQISGTTSEAHGIDRFGRVCGSANFVVTGTTERQSAVVWDQGVVTDLGAGAGFGSVAFAINDFGEIVGNFFDVTLGSRACIFENGGATDLNTLIAPGTGWTLEVANDVDDEGRIVGFGDLGGATRAFILEPDCKGSFTVYGTGCAGSLPVEPILTGAGCPSPDRDFALFLHAGAANQVGFFFVGTSNGVVPVRPGCDLQVVPLALPPLLITLDGAGELWAPTKLPSGTPTFDLFLQSLFVTPGSHLISATKPVQLHFE
jgi:probable HAF family extracellular repeat protein